MSAIPDDLLDDLTAVLGNGGGYKEAYYRRLAVQVWRAGWRPGEQIAKRVETYRKALMVAHAHDWDMDLISEAAHICARADGESVTK